MDGRLGRLVGRKTRMVIDSVGFNDKTWSTARAFRIPITARRRTHHAPKHDTLVVHITMTIRKAYGT